MPLDEAVFDVAHRPAAVRLVRHQVRLQLRAWNTTSDLEVVLLLVSEAVTNAIVHGEAPACVRLQRDEELLRISVVDSCVQAVPVNLDPPAEADRGRGVQLIATLARRWGVDVGETSKTVWFELAA